MLKTLYVFIDSFCIQHLISANMINHKVKEYKRRFWILQNPSLGEVQTRKLAQISSKAAIPSLWHIGHLYDYLDITCSPRNRNLNEGCRESKV